MLFNIFDLCMHDKNRSYGILNSKSLFLANISCAYLLPSQVSFISIWP